MKGLSLLTRRPAASLASSSSAETAPGPLHVRLTPQGRAGGLAAVIVLAAALNTANNLLYLFTTLILFLYPLSWFMARACLRRVAAEIHVPPRLRAGEESPAVVRLRHVRGRLGAAGLGVRIEAGDEEERAFWSYLAPEESLAREVELRPERRGVLPVRVELFSPFPFGLLEAHRVLAERHPLVLPARLDPRARPRGGAGQRGEQVVLMKGTGAELYDIREYVPGEDARFLDWKATARLGTAMIRENAREAERKAAVVVDPGLPDDADLDPEEARTRVEEAISRAAGALEGYGTEGWSLRLLTPEGSVAGSPTAQLEHLALLEVLPRPWPRTAWAGRLEAGEAWIVFSAGLEGAATGAERAS